MFRAPRTQSCSVGLALRDQVRRPLLVFSPFSRAMPRAATPFPVTGCVFTLPRPSASLVRSMPPRGFARFRAGEVPRNGALSEVSGSSRSRCIPAPWTRVGGRHAMPPARSPERPHGVSTRRAPRPTRKSPAPTSPAACLVQQSRLTCFWRGDGDRRTLARPRSPRRCGRVRSRARRRPAPSARTPPRPR